MDMVVYMVDAEAMVSVTAGTVAELQVRIVDVCFSADGAFVAVWLAFLVTPGHLCGPLEVNSLLRGAYPQWAKVSQGVLAADDYEIKQRDER